MTMVKLFNGYVKKTMNIKLFQTDDMYVPIGTHAFANQLESTRANYSTIVFMPHEDRERSAQNKAYDNQVKQHLKYLFVNASAKDKDEIYPVMVSEIAAAQQKHRLYKKYLKDKPFKDKDPLISLKVISETKVLVYTDKRLVIPPKNMQSKVVQWYHHYLPSTPGREPVRRNHSSYYVVAWNATTHKKIRENVCTMSVRKTLQA